MDRRYHNKPAAGQIAVLMPGDGSQTVERRDVLLTTQQGCMKRINEMHPSYDPLQYVLLFPTGDLGYHFNINNNRGTNSSGIAKTVSCREYYAYRLMWRDSEENIILKGRRLFCQYLVDMYAKVETERLLWHKLHQKEIRAELYQGLLDSVQAGDTNAANIGRRVVLAPSFTGGPRQMHKTFQDSMAIVRKFGKPSLFITFTGNPQWLEIKRELLTGQTPNDRPDLLCRVFHQKNKEFHDDFFIKNVFGHVLGYSSVIEYQKRGFSNILMHDE